MTPLPIDPYVPEIVAAVRQRRALVLTAAPGAGKTTRVPPALIEDGPAIVLQPRRVAARTIARRIAAEQGWTLGREIGWHVRFERNFTRETRLLVATEGILTARLQQDPLLSDFTTIVLDEFHERSIHADLGLALARQAWRARDDLRIVVMSATLDVEQVRAFLHDCPSIAVAGRLHPIDVDYAPSDSVAAAASRLLRATAGNVLCFLPGAPEIERATTEVRNAVGDAADVVPLHGSLKADEQDRAVAAAPGRRVILATNIAETSLTVPGVHAVVDSGLHKVARYDEDRGIDALELERIPADSAEQRAGRAGRLGRGRVVRLWDRADRLRPHGEADVHRVDLSDAVLDVLVWGGDARTFEWFDAPPAARIEAALILLEQLGAVEKARVTAIGAKMKRLPLQPRLARILLESPLSRQVALACALLSERRATIRNPANTSSDLLSAVDDQRSLPSHVRVVADRLVQTHGQSRRITETEFLKAIFSGYPDRVARRRLSGSNRFLLASGHGAVLGPESGVRDAEFIVAVDAHAGRRGENAEATIRVASAIDPEWLSHATRRDVVHDIDAAGRVRAMERELYGAIVLAERPAVIDPEVAARLLADAYRARGWSDTDLQLLRRIRFAALPVDEAGLLMTAAYGRRSVNDIDLQAAVAAIARDLDRLAPAALTVPSGRTRSLRYEEDGSVVASVKLQELFGLAESPRIGPNRQPIVFELLAPNGRPVQTTRDLRNFWNTTYQEVRKELRGRYPRHPWPENPWTAPPTARTKPRHSTS